jgi:hypothetical protein
VERPPDSHGWDEETDAGWEDFNAELEAMIGLPVHLRVSEGAGFEKLLYEEGLCLGGGKTKIIRTESVLERCTLEDWENPNLSGSQPQSLTGQS